jgi:hypothetical protein
MRAWEVWRKIAYISFVGKPEKKGHLGDLDVDGIIIVTWL